MGVIISEKTFDDQFFQDLDTHIDLDDQGFYNWVNQTYHLNKIDTIAKVMEMFKRYYFIRDPSIFELAGKYKFVIASNHLSVIRDYLEKQAVLKYFQTVIISSEIGFKKPDKNFYRIMIDKIDDKAENILFIDNTEENIIAARKFNLQTFNFDRNNDQYNLKYQVEQELLKYQ